MGPCCVQMHRLVRHTFALSIWLLQMEHLFMHLCIPAVRHVGSDCRWGCWAVLQSCCKTFVSLAIFSTPGLNAESSVCRVSEGNWRLVMSARNASGDAFPGGDACSQLYVPFLLLSAQSAILFYFHSYVSNYHS